MILFKLIKLLILYLFLLIVWIFFLFLLYLLEILFNIFLIKFLKVIILVVLLYLLIIIVICVLVNFIFLNNVFVFLDWGIKSGFFNILWILNLFLFLCFDRYFNKFLIWSVLMILFKVFLYIGNFVYFLFVMNFISLFFVEFILIVEILVLWVMIFLIVVELNLNIFWIILFFELLMNFLDFEVFSFKMSFFLDNVLLLFCGFMLNKWMIRFVEDVNNIINGFIMIVIVFKNLINIYEICLGDFIVICLGINFLKIIWK